MLTKGTPVSSLNYNLYSVFEIQTAQNAHTSNKFKLPINPDIGIQNLINWIIPKKSP